MAAIVDVEPAGLHQAQVALVDQCRGIEHGDARGSFEAISRKLTQIVIQERQQSIERLVVALPDCGE